MPRSPRARLEQLELHLWSRDGRGAALDLSAARSTPRRELGTPLLDLGLLVGGGDEAASARALRIDDPDDPMGGGFSLTVEPTLIRGALPGDGRVQLSIAAAFRRQGLVLGEARGELNAFGRRWTFDGARLLLLERSGARRPYAWARALLRGEVDGAPIVCQVETARGRAGSVVLPELGRLRLLGPGVRALPRACAIAPLPLKAEYGTGRLRASALGPGVRCQLELAAPPAATALFEVVDPSGEAAYAHRALGATARLLVRARNGHSTEIALDGRYEWGARAGDPRVALRAWPRPSAGRLA
jgi:hypothetical protein